MALLASQQDPNEVLTPEEIKQRKQHQFLIMCMIDFPAYKRRELTKREWERKRKARKTANQSRKANRNK